MSFLFIANVRVADGSGREPYAGSLRLGGGRILAVGPGLAPEPGEALLDGGGMLLAPGFIDAHGHSDLSLLAAPAATGKITQGVTTEIAGNCGLSPFPVTEANRAHLNELYRQYGVGIDWDGLNGYRARLAAAGARLKLRSFCGHNTLRAAVAGYETKQLSRPQLAAMRELLAGALEDGALGLSLGLLYTPGCFADRAEIAALLRTVAAHGKLVAIHLRSEGAALLESLEEFFAAARQAGQRRLLVSHFKTAGEANFHKLGPALAMIEARRRDGFLVHFDRYPYTESMTQLSVVAPGEFGQLDDGALMRRLGRPAEFERLVALLAAGGRDWRRVRLAGSTVPAYAPWAGAFIADLAAQRQCEPARLIAEILKADAVGAQGAFSGLSEENLHRILADPHCCCGSDESARPCSFRFGRSHPRGFGAFPVFFQRLRALKLSDGEIIRKMTALPAEIFQLTDRGRLAAGLAADLVLLDPDNFRSRADFAHPHRPAEGVLQVWIDGQPQLPRLGK